MADQSAPPVSRLELLLGKPRDKQFARLRADLLERIFRGPHRDNYALRGSTVLRHWFPDAREPNDVDLVALYPHDPQRCIGEVFDSCTDPALGPEPFPVRPENVLPMWEYDIFPGVRFHVPTDDRHRLPTVQLDVAFDNVPPLPTETIRLRPSPLDPPVDVRAWTRTACLTSKLCWVANDCSVGTQPDSDDIRDAILLANRGDVDAAALRRLVPEVLRAQGRDLSVFDAWDVLVRHGMALAVKPDTADARFADCRRGVSFGDGRMREYAEVLAAERCWLLRDLQFALGRLLSGLLWFPTDEEWAFLHAMAKDRNDRLTPLVYADWLDERGDSRGELLRLHAARATGARLTAGQRNRVEELVPQVPARWVRLASLD